MDPRKEADEFRESMRRLEAKQNRIRYNTANRKQKEIRDSAIKPKRTPKTVEPAEDSLPQFKLLRRKKISNGSAMLLSSNWEPIALGSEKQMNKLRISSEYKAANSKSPDEDFEYTVIPV